MKEDIMWYIDILRSRTLLLVLFMLVTELVSAQVRRPDASTIKARNGWYITPHNRLHAVFVFVELDFGIAYIHYDPVPQEGRWRWKAGPTPTWNDDRRKHLDGVPVELIGQCFDGGVLVGLCGDDFVVGKDVRWCGDIHLVEQLELARGCRISLDQGYLMQVTTAVQQIAGKDVFALPAEMTLRSGSDTMLNQPAKMCVAIGSGLVIESEVVVEMGDFAAIKVESGAYLRVEDGAVINSTGRSGGIQRREGALEERHPLLMAQLAPTKRELMNGKKFN